MHTLYRVVTDGASDSAPLMQSSPLTRGPVRRQRPLRVSLRNRLDALLGAVACARAGLGD
jgi:hypothetical protein